MKKFSSFVLATCLMASIMMPTNAYGATFQDTMGTKYEVAIENLAKSGVITGYGGQFNPAQELTRQEAATMIQATFKLVDVPYRESANKELEKTFISTETNLAMLESAVLPAANDVSNWSKDAVETIVEARLMTVENGAFDPKGSMTRKEFATVVGKAIYGAEKTIDYVGEALKDGLLPADLELDETIITREEAAYILNQIVANKGFKIIPMMFTSDIHGHLVPYEARGSEMKLGAMARIATLAEQLRGIEAEMLLLDAGDSPYNTNLANLFKGESTVDVMNVMGYDATTLGNHDFDFVFENLLALAERAEYKMLSANTYMADGSYPEQLAPYYIEEIEGVKVAIVGLTDDESKLYTHFSNTENIELKDEFEVAREVIEKAKAESDVVVVLSHLHRDNMNLPLEVAGIDVEVGGGNDIFGRPEYVGDTLVINPGAHAAAVTQVNMNILNNKMIGYTANQMVVTDAIEPNQAVEKVLNEYTEKMGTMMGEVVGTATDDFVWAAPLVRTQENALANVIADSQRIYLDADIALQNGGGVRAGISKGEMTLNDIYTALPFDNKVTLIETTGKVVWEALEHGVSLYPATAGQFLQVSGIQYAFDGSKPAGERITSVTMPDGTPIDLGKTYRVVINDFMAGGGDGYAMFNVLNESTGLAKEAKLIIQTNDFIRDVFTNYMKQVKTVVPKLEGRIQVTNPQETDSKIG